jgi:hypothetical protein
MALTYYKYGADILEDVLFRSGELTATTGVTSDYRDAAKRYIQRRYHDLVIAQPWPWALSSTPGTLDIVADQTNTATCTQDSTTVTLDTIIATSVAGYWFEIDSEQVPYRISSHTAGTGDLVLDANYKEDSVSSGACRIYKDEYDLASDCWKIWRAWDRNNPHVIIDIIQTGEMHDVHTSRRTSSSNTYLLSVIRDGVARITPWPETDDITVEYEYTAKIDNDLSFSSDSSDVPVIPDVDRAILSDLATADVMFDKNDPKAENMLQLGAIKYQQMINTYITVGRVRKYVREGQSIGGS